MDYTLIKSTTNEFISLGEGFCLNKANSIEAYRKKRNRQQRIRRVVIFMVFLIIVSILLLTNKRFQEAVGIDINPIGKSDLVEKGTGFPIELPLSAKYSLEPMGEDIVLLTDTYVFTYSDKGRELVSSLHGYKVPALRTNSKRYLVFDEGGSELIVGGRSKEYFRKTYDEKIMLARISPDDDIAVVTDSNRYESIMIIYDKRGEEIFRWSSDEQKIIEVEFTADSNGCIVSTIGASDGQISSKLHRFEFSEDKERWSTELIGTMVLSMNSLSDGKTAIIGDDKSAIIDKTGQVVYDQEYRLPVKCYSSMGDMTIILLDDSANRQTIIRSFTSNGENNKEIILGDTVKSALVKDKTIFVLDEKEIIVYNANMEKVSSRDLEYDYSQLLLIDNAYYLIGAGEIAKYVEE